MPAQVTEVAGAMVAEFTADGTIVFGYDNLVVHQVVTGSDILGGSTTVDMFISFNGTFAGTYLADGTFITALGPSPEIMITVDTFVNNESAGTITNPARPEDFPLGAQLSAQYTCSPTTLTMRLPGSSSNIPPIEYRRVRP